MIPASEGAGRRRTGKWAGPSTLPAAAPPEPAAPVAIPVGGLPPRGPRSGAISQGPRRRRRWRTRPARTDPERRRERFALDGRNPVDLQPFQRGGA